MKTQRILLSLLLIFLASSEFSYAQKSYKWMEKKCLKVTIVDAGQLYSTYEVSEEEKKLLREKVKLNEQQIETLLKNCKESSWEGGMKDLDSRTNNNDIIQKFKAYKVAEFDNEYLLVIPTMLNQGLPKSFSQSKDIFLIIGKSGVGK